MIVGSTCKTHTHTDGPRINLMNFIFIWWMCLCCFTYLLHSFLYVYICCWKTTFKRIVFAGDSCWLLETIDKRQILVLFSCEVHCSKDFSSFLSFLNSKEERNHHHLHCDRSVKQCIHKFLRENFPHIFRGSLWKGAIKRKGDQAKSRASRGDLKGENRKHIKWRQKWGKSLTAQLYFVYHFIRLMMTSRGSLDAETFAMQILLLR